MLAALKGFNPSEMRVKAEDSDFLEFLGQEGQDGGLEEILNQYNVWLRKEYGGNLYKGEVREKLSAAPRFLRELVSAGLVSQTSGRNFVIADRTKIREFTSQIRRIFRSNPRFVRWFAYYLLSRKDHFSTEEFTRLTNPPELIGTSVDSVEFTQTRKEGKLVAQSFDPILDEGTGYRLFVKHGKKYETNPKFRVSKHLLPARVNPTGFLFYAAATLRGKRASLNDIVSIVWEEAKRNDEKDLGEILERDDLGWKFPGTPEKLVENIDEPLRRPKGEVEDASLDILDTGGFSNDQLSRILGADASTISRSIKRLKKERLLVGTGGFGEYSRVYWITNCDNCPWSYKKEDCRKESLEKIITICGELGFELKLDLGKYRNQTLRTFAKMLVVAKEQIEAEEYRPDLQEMKELVDLALQPIADQVKEGGSLDSERRIVKIKGKEISLPLLYTIGLRHGLGNGRMGPKPRSAM